MKLMHRLAACLVAVVALSASYAGAARAEISEYLRADRINRNAASGQTPLPVSGRVTKIVVTPTVTAGAAYASGNLVGGLLTFAGVATTDLDGNVDNAGGMIQSVTINFKSAQTSSPNYDFLWCGSSNLPNTTLTDKTAIGVTGADFDKCKAVHITDCTSLGTPTACGSGNLAMPFFLDAGSTGYGVLVTRGTPTYTATSDVSVKLEIVR